MLAQNSCEYSIIWPDMPPLEFTGVLPIIDTIKTDTSRIVYRINTCMGKGSFSTYDKSGNIKLTGQFEESLGLLIKQSMVFNIFDFKEEEVVLRCYYEGLKDGKWVYYDSTGNSFREEIYKNGVFVKLE
jgi:antitoxin component YwqK of YwqJK toxin-antitoxin module